MPQKDLALLLRLNKSWYDGIPAAELYAITRAWWVMSAANAQRVSRVLAVAGGVVREVYEPTEWLQSPIEGLENRIGFNGVVAPDRDTYLGRDVSHLFRQGSANPVRYLPIDELLDSASRSTDSPPESRPDVEAASNPVEPGLLERVLPLLDAFEHDLLWHQSRAGQELFHSNTIAWLLKNFPAATAPLLNVLGGTGYDPIDRIDVWRERRNLDIVIDPAGAAPKIVVENKLYSVPYPAQLLKYNAYPLPWSPAHGEAGAADTRYVLLSLMKPSFPLPEPWSQVGYQEVARLSTSWTLIPFPEPPSNSSVIGAWSTASSLSRRPSTRRKHWTSSSLPPTPSPSSRAEASMERSPACASAVSLRWCNPTSRLRRAS